ncbi:MAG: hypothetical protein HY766_00730 [candidate division NC10 bacterium]|nr:hypothetical protein [candidate division NC10 bacterium]MBI4839821.1 hypothetical protein [candidate division NC10 bacterium]
MRIICPDRQDYPDKIPDDKGLTALLSEHKVKHPLLISLERESRKIRAKVRALPWDVFLRELWSGALGV